MESNVLKGGCTYVTLTPPERYTCKQGEEVERDRWGETGGRRRRERELLKREGSRRGGGGGEERERKRRDFENFILQGV